MYVMFHYLSFIIFTTSPAPSPRRNCPIFSGKYCAFHGQALPNMAYRSAGDFVCHWVVQFHPAPHLSIWISTASSHTAPHFSIYGSEFLYLNIYCVYIYTESTIHPALATSGHHSLTSDTVHVAVAPVTSCGTMLVSPCYC